MGGRRAAGQSLSSGQIGISDTGNLQSLIARDLSHPQRGPRRWIFREEFAVVLVHLVILVVVLQIDERLHHVLHPEAGRLSVFSISARQFFTLPGNSSFGR